ncbi:hypothetical protein MJO29_003075 [Puccinia striiformis f. sp. tritici]|uniref:hypothetical protein n=1 Tax=Puccinia striiformis f. sp. tritici TaxID=168172 RepID=UPI0020081728|nr:hypothetical protein Pst134EA_005066 [Puccinia striiformis f. sp. tritici]KAH9471158.1 hypothetical protein Pst134EA_005066 [Puccinia striiformis f. sp. tritici]KAI7964977.1 hypothetical protein MJO29_003075 [Puccinia striiformis f. sp. tritici]
MGLISENQRDQIYVGFLAIHLISAICVDLQPLLPHGLQLDGLKGLMNFYLENTSDPLMINAHTTDPNYLWFRWFLVHEALFFVPCFILGIHGLIKRTPKIYPLLLAYAAAASTTTATSLIVVVWGDHHVPLTPTKLGVLASAYGPFFIIPVVLLIDMYIRIQRLIIRVPSGPSHLSTPIAKKKKK